MNKTWLIIQREYLTRVRNKTFLLSTFLTPLLIVGLIAIVTIITVKGVSKETIAVIDPNNQLQTALTSDNIISFQKTNDVDTSNYLKKGFTGILFAPKSGINSSNNFQLFSEKTMGVIASDRIEDALDKAIENQLLESNFNISTAKIDSIREAAKKTGLDIKVLSDDDKIEEGNSGIAYGVGYGAAFLIYITLFIYGTMVMRGVMEEKTNRIAEVVISSVRPFQLMLGKIVGIGAVGLTQFLLWIVLIIGLSSLANAFIPPDVLQQVQQANTQMPGSAQQTSEAVMRIAQAKQTLSAVNWPMIIGCFLFYFLFGYLFYAALFAAIGSAVNEDPQDAQSLVLPVTMPIVIGIIIMINAITNPTSSLAFWGSIIPFTSPIVMMARVPFGVPGTVPYWELGLSMALLAGGFLLTTWLSAKIYRTGILLYGKKVTWKEMIKWINKKS